MAQQLTSFPNNTICNSQPCSQNDNNPLQSDNQPETNFNVIYIKTENFESFEDENEQNLRNDSSEGIDPEETPDQIKLRKSRERKRLFNLNKRRNETDEEKALRRAKARKQKAALRKMRREKLLEGDLSVREKEALAKERDRKRIAERRKNESEEKKEERRAKDRERHKAKRAWMRNIELGLVWGKMPKSNGSPNSEGDQVPQEPPLELLKQIRERKAKDRERNALKRMNETEEQKAERRAKDRQQHAEMRRWKKQLLSEGDVMLLEKDAMMKERDRKRIAEKRKNETEEQKEERRQKDRERHAARRAWMKNLWHKMAQSGKLNSVNIERPFTPELVLIKEEPQSPDPESSISSILENDGNDSSNTSTEEIPVKIKQEPVDLKQEEFMFESEAPGQSLTESKEKPMK